MWASKEMSTPQFLLECNKFCVLFMVFMFPPNICTPPSQTRSLGIPFHFFTICLEL